MDNAKFWWSSSETPQPPIPPVDVIGHSLRFRGGSRLTRAGMSRPAGDYTLSLWVKCAWTNTSDNNSIFGNNTSVTGFKIGNPNGSGDSQLQCRDGASSNSFDTAARLKDPSAWYHFVFQTVGTNTTAFVNGVQHGNPVNTFGATGDAVIGSGNAANMDEAFHGYMADVYCIDGQTLEPTAFGRENDQGVWVPREVDFTPTEMRWSDFLTVSNGDFGTPAENAFNGLLDDGDGRCFTSTGADLTWEPPADNPATFTTTLEIFNTNQPSQQNISWNGNTVNPTGGWVTVFTDPSPDPANPNVIDVNQPLVIDSIGSQRAELYAVRLDGELVLNPFIWSAQLTADNGAVVVEPTQAFLDSTLSTSTNIPASITFTPNPALSCNTFGVQHQEPDMTVAINGGAAQPCIGANGSWTDFAVPGGELTTAVISRNNGTQVLNWQRTRLNGAGLLLDGVNGSYGPNGFHLDFADPNDLGADRSGNGNDFEAIAFNTAPVGVFSSELTTNGTWEAAQPPAQCFDSSDLTEGTAITSDNTQCFVEFGPATAIDITGQTVQLFTYNQPSTITLGGASTAVTAQGIQNVDVGTATEISATTPLRITHNSINSGTGWAQLIVGGTVIADNTGEDFDLMQDSPTQNYATFNAITGAGASTTANPTDANLTLRGAAGITITEKPPGETIYFEVQTGFVNNGRIWNNWWNTIQILNGQTEAIQGGGSSVPPTNVTDQGGLAFDISANVFANNANEQVEISSTNLAANDIIGVQISDTNITVFINGVASSGINNLAFGNNYSEGMYIYARNASAASSPVEFLHINFGQQPFLHRPAELDDTNNLQTQNLPAAPIPNGRDHFQAITGPGNADGVMWREDNVNNNDPEAPLDLSRELGPWNGTATYLDGSGIASFTCVLTVEQDTFTWRLPSGFNSGAVMYVSEDGTTWRNFNPSDQFPPATTTPWPDVTNFTVDDGTPIKYVRWMAADVSGGLNCGLQNPNGTDGILGAAQSTFPNGLWWIKDRVNTNQHQFVDSVTNAAQGGGNWANTSPTISQAIAYAAPAGNSVAWCWNAAEPATSGFNIVQYTGQNPTTTTVPHGLPGIPDMIITQAKTGTTRNYAVFHSALGEGQWLQLNGSDQALADATMWANTAPDETNFFVGAANTTNFSGAVYTAYCWTAIPGHSAFGSFQGNSDTNGVFVYLGFRPQMLMIRTTGAGDSFFMLDSTRSPNNPIGVDGLLNAGSTDPEGTWSARDIDFLSNGFKLRSSSGSVNGGTVVYAAWAENPFGGSNVSPANAR